MKVQFQWVRGSERILVGRIEPETDEDYWHWINSYTDLQSEMPERFEPHVCTEDFTAGFIKP